MNGDHRDDNMLIARAFGYPDATASTMVGVSAAGGTWRVTDAAGEHELEVAWPNAPISERPQIRREVVLVYRAACKELGVPAREEHEAPQHLASQHPHAGGSPHAHGGNPHAGGRNPHAAAGVEYAEGEKPFSVVVRESSWGDHSDSEGATFMEDIMRGKATKQDYTDLVIQHYFMYVALEGATAKLSGDAALATFHRAELERLEALKQDLVFLVGENWENEISAVPATAAYAARINEIAEEGWVAGVVAHHYTRYLGDLSGGQMIAKRVAKQHGFDTAGIEFYNFATLGDIAAFKTGYREALDALGESLSADEQKRMTDEVRKAYAFNTEVFIDLGKQKAAAAA